MNEKIFLLNNHGELVEMNESTYLTEDNFQKLLVDYPSLISGSQINPDKPRRWLLISREFGVPGEYDKGNRWSLDHLFIDQDGIPTLVEVKRSTDSRIRREVIGQIFDYAANAVLYWTIEEIKYRFEESCKSNIQDPSLILNEFLQEETDSSTFWETTKTNLKAGKVRLLIISDTIPKELQRIIEFLNEQMNPAEILGIEIKQFVGSDLKTLVPRVIGQTSKAQNIKGKQRSESDKWNEESFFEEITNLRGPQEAEIAKEILNWVKRKVNTIWYGEGKSGSLIPIHKIQNRSKYRFSFAIWTNGYVEILFQHIKNRQPFDNEEKRIQLLEKLNEIKGMKIPKEKISARPSFPISFLKETTELQKFIETFDWYFDEFSNQ